MSPRRARSPDWDRLYATAVAQEGHFTTGQAWTAGYSPQLLRKHCQAGRMARVRRGIYRLSHYPSGEHEHLAVVWLWSEQRGVLSHQTALALHGLSDALPAQVHLTLPARWSTRRFRVPDGVALHFADLSADQRAWFGPVPITTPARTIEDCARAAISPELLRQAARQALRRGLLTRRDLPETVRALRPLGGLAS